MKAKRIKTYKLFIKGKVQDVNFRYWFSNIATSLSLNGYIQNHKNKDEVNSIIQGEINNILNIIEKSKAGPKLAIVESVESIEFNNNIIYSEFKIKY